MGFSLYQVMAGCKPLVGPILCQDDINVIAGRCSWMEKDTRFPTIWSDSCMILQFGLYWPEVDGI
jgi:hypothetical protein